MEIQNSTLFMLENKHTTVYKPTDLCLFVCLRWGFTAQSTHWGYVERSQFT